MAKKLNTPSANFLIPREHRIKAIQELYDAVRNGGGGGGGSIEDLTPAQKAALNSGITADKLNELETGVSGAVQTSSQSLTESQKSTARNNIGALGTNDVPPVPSGGWAAANDLSALDAYVHSLNTTPVVVGPKPETGTEGTIYRVPGDTTYTDWMYYNGTWSALATYDAATLESQFGYYKWTGTGNAIALTTSNQDAGSPIGSYDIKTGGSFKIKMTNAATGAATLSMNGKTATPLYYNGAAVSASNTWEAGEVISVYYDGTYYQASNAQGGGGKAEKIKYDNSKSILSTENVQGAVDELGENIGDTSQKTGIGYTLVDNTAYEITNGKVTIKTRASLYRRLGPIDVTNFTKVGARFYLTGSYSYVTAFTDAEDNVIGDKLVNTTEDYVEYNVPEGATKLYVCGRKQTSGNVDTANLSVYGKVAQSVEEALEKLKSDTASVGSLSYRRVEPVSENTHNGYFMNNASYGAVWMYSSSYTRTHLMIERTDNMKTVIMTRNNGVAAYVAFLKTYAEVTSNLQPMDLCDGFSITDGIIRSMSEHTTKTLIIPDDCNYIVFNLVYQDSLTAIDETPANILIGYADIGIPLFAYEDIDVHTLIQYEGYPAVNQNYNSGLPMYISSSSIKTRRHIALKVQEGERYIIEANTGVKVAFSAVNKTTPTQYESVEAVGNTLDVVRGAALLKVPAGAHYMIMGSSLNTLGDIIKKIVSIKRYEENKLLDIVSKNSTFDILVAASDSDASDKSKADVVCDGINDAAIITALMQTYSRKHNIILAAGTFYIHSFSGGGDGTVGVPYVAIPLTEGTATGFTAKIKGVFPTKYTTSYINDDTQDIRGTRFVVTEECYNSLDNDKYYAVFGGIDGTYNTWKKYQLVLENVGIYLPDNKKNIICVDGINIGGMDLYHCMFKGNPFNNRHPTTEQPLQIGVDGCIGVRGHRGANNGLVVRWEYCNALSMGVGFSVCGEHLVITRCGGIGNKYTFWFNQFPDLRNDEDAPGQGDVITGKSWLYPNVLIQPVDEVCANYMRFGINPQKQGLDIIGLNVEHHNEMFSSTGNGHLATEDVPGSWAGNISYVIGHNLNNDYPSRPNKYRNMWEYPLFANDGSGKNFNSKNEAHALTGTTATRLTYAANWWQRYWDTDLGKEVICIDPTTSPQTWALADGTIV